MKFRYAWLALVLALMGAFVAAPFSGVEAATKDKNFLKNIPVTGTLADGGAFKGQVSITQFGYDTVTGLWVSGRVIGTATTASGTVYKNIDQSFSRADATLNETSAANSVMPQATCQILFLDIGPIFLDLLGLQVDLSEIVLDISAVSGAGNLLGNLLCAVAGLLDPNGFLTDLIGGLTQLLDFLNQLNQLLR
ncbi:MAG TPA: hypothetical protein VGD58_09650 [Herpetosiphonaceae bacterium]